MVNISDLIIAVKDKKEKEFEIFNKARFICETLGCKSFEEGISTHIYFPEADNIRLYLNKGKLLNGENFQHLLISNLDHFQYFDYFNNSSTEKGRVDRYVSGEWENLIKDHYEMSLENI